MKPVADSHGTIAPRLEARGIWKTYGSVVANRDVSVSIRTGTVHAILGENGAGKSTLMKILYGVEQPDRGEILLDGSEIHLKAPEDAIGHGIGMVFQHFGLVPGLTAVENIVLGVEPTRRGALDRSATNRAVQEVIDRFGLTVGLDDKVGQMSAARQQRVEILKALYRGAETVILDEPTALLTPQERHSLFQAIRHLTKLGTTVLFITHKLAEVEEVADDLTVMRHGRIVGSGAVASLSREELVRMMVGDAVTQSRRASGSQGNAVLDVRAARVLGAEGRPVVREATVQAHAGEVLGLAGVEGNGQLEFLEMLAGLHPLAGGEVTIEGSPLRKGNRDVRAQGVAYVPEDRLAAGLAAEISILENVLANRVGQGGFSSFGRLDRKGMRREAVELVERFDVRCPGVDAPVGSLSGGNMQKVILAREISAQPRLLLVAEPTRGLDIAAIALVHEQLARAAEDGVAVVALSSDIDELLAISTRIAVFCAARLVAILENESTLTASELGKEMLGARAEVAAA
jgi:general nucleoside transport system ATP-binding protein